MNSAAMFSNSETRPSATGFPIQPDRLGLRTTVGRGSITSIVVNLHPEYLVDEQQKRKAVLLPMSEWEQIVQELEELDDIRAYDAAKEQSSDSIPFEQAIRELRQDPHT